MGKNELNNGDDGMRDENLGIKTIIFRLLSDEDFKEDLIEDPEKALAEYKLTEVQKILIKSLSAEDLENLNPDNIDEYFSADAAVYTPDEDADIDEFDTFEENDLMDD